MDASKAAQSLGITTSTEYRQLYHVDPRLHYYPSRIYAREWSGWPAFLGTSRARRVKVPPEFYGDYDLAKRAAKNLKITTRAEYLKLYIADDKLPINPDVVYSTYWKGWDVFLSPNSASTRALEIYPTFKEARKAARKLGLSNAREYIKYYSRDKRLPSNPSCFYTAWTTWFDFLGTRSIYQKYYATLRQASLAANRLGITTAREYIKNYKNDERLPSNPDQFYSDWNGWIEFLNLKQQCPPT